MKTSNRVVSGSNFVRLVCGLAMFGLSAGGGTVDAAVSDSQPRTSTAGRTATLGFQQVAEGILVEPDAGALEPPSVQEYEHERQREISESESEYAEEPAPSHRRRHESRQEQLERPGERQLETERGDQRQEDLEMPDGPGVKY
jgi:hypothetical protein